MAGKDYISELRKVLGHELIMTTGCGVLITDNKDKLLLQKRSDTLEWCVPGGAMEPAETYMEAAKREIREETGLTVSDLRLFGIYSGDNRVIHYPNGDVVYSLSIVFITDRYSGSISDSDSEVIEHRFFNRYEIPDKLFLPDRRPILDWAKGETGIIIS